MTKAVSYDILKNALGSHISDFCDNGFVKDTDEHCAHFVSHILEITFGLTCRAMSSQPKAAAANLRVQEIFPKCPRVGAWADLPDDLSSGLAFIGNAGNIDVRHRTMSAVPRLHIGIFLGADRRIYHYSNRDRQVVSQTPDAFSLHYAPPDNAMFWGAFPI